MNWERATQLHEMFHLTERTLLLDYNPEVRAAFPLHVPTLLSTGSKVARNNRSDNFLKVRLLTTRIGIPEAKVLGIV